MINTNWRIYKLLLSECFFILVVLFSEVNASSETTIRANPDFLSSGIFWTTEGVPTVAIGNFFEFSLVQIGGLFEARNEKRFNQGLLPNHNWRGVGCIGVCFFKRTLPLSIQGFISIKHESAHPTMGICEQTDNAYEQIYDNTYRWMVLNSIGVSSLVSYAYLNNQLKAVLNYNFYFQSKNTPELSGSKLGIANGLSIGIENKFVCNQYADIFLSLFDRIVFQGNEIDRGPIFDGNGAALTNRVREYPVISGMNTFIVKIGIDLHLFTGNTLTPCIKWLYGNPYGFVDSRDNRSVFSCGIALSL